MQDCKDKAVYTVPKCKCHLCQKTVFNECNEDEDIYDWYDMNGKILAVHDVESCIPPSIFCPFLDMWKSLYYPCCCTSHDKPGDCGINGKSKCYCPRCCFDCMYKIWPAYLKVSAGEGKIDCQTCQLKSKFYTPCKHFRGHCSP